ncbi:ectopic P granules protein 5 homolog [Nephila pilipes]|uniref:Ectopic P granules protein 5 homolog n=1 Tax=Nephila pilipes TaxID=299642 RepID=A0A8X6QZW9_NEPPI|nr:ectopic P granules protein 5 homolog [Nephila pilipes]
MELMKERPKTKKSKKLKTSDKSSRNHFELTKNLESSEKAEASFKASNVNCESITTNQKITSEEANHSLENADESVQLSESKSCTDDIQVIQVKSVDQNEYSKDDIESNIPQNVVLEIKEFACTLREENKIQSDVVRVKTFNTFSEKTETKNVYPDLKNIQRYKHMEDIESLRTLTQTYTEEYLNKTYNGVKRRYEEFQRAVCNIENYPLYELIKEYQNARNKFNEAHTKQKYLNSKLKIEKNNMWKLVKKDAFSKGHCEDGNTVSVSKSYFIKELDENKFEEVIEILRELEQIAISDVFYSYLVELSKMKIEQYVYNMINYFNSLDDPCKNASTLGFDKKDILKKCISVLFQYQRQSIKDKNFLEVCQKWLNVLVFVLLQNGRQSDYLFIINHIVRSPNGIQVWASSLLQFPGSTSCTEEAINTLGCPCLYYLLLVLYLVLNPAPDRDFFLRNVKTNISDSTGGKFILLDSDGEEEELFEVVRNWTNEDVISLLNQISIASVYEHILFDGKDQTIMVIKSPSNGRIVKIFAFSTALINILFSGLVNYASGDFEVSVECICSMIRHAVCYASDYWEHCEKLDIPSKSALQAEYDRFIFHVLYRIYNFEKIKIWKFLPTFPYKCISKKMLWNIIWIFHSPNCFEEVYLAKDIDLKLNDDNVISMFIKNLKTCDNCDQLYLLNAYKSVALFGNTEKELLCFLIHEVFEISFVENALHHLSKEGAIVLSCIVQKYPHLLSALLKEVETNKDEAVNFSLYMFEEFDLSAWLPEAENIRLIREWLLETPLSSPKNFLARMLLSKMNWDFLSQDELVLPIQLHQETAVLVLQAYMKFDSKGSEWSVSNGLDQMLNFATVGSFVRKDEAFVPWAWTLLFSLKLHALDKKFPFWGEIYDGFINVNFLPDPFEELWLQSLLKGYEEKHPAACYLFLVMTNIGHNVHRLMVEGLQCLTALIESRQYLAAIHSLYYILPFFAKNIEELLSKPEFINAMSDLIGADMTVFSNYSGPVVGAVLHKISAMIKHQVSQAWNLTVECANPLLKLWTCILLKVLSFQERRHYNLKDSAKQVHYLLDVVVKISVVDNYTRNFMIDLLYTFGNPLLISTTVQPSVWNKFFGSNTESYTILRKQTLPDYPCLAWFILRSETKQKQTQDLWFQIQKEIAKDMDITPIAALKKVCNFMKIKQPPLESLPIYRWAIQILGTPVSHPVLPLLWQNFFYYYFEKIAVSDDTPRSLGLNYFKSGKHFPWLMKMKSRALEAAEYYKACLESSDSVASNEDLMMSETDRRIISKECIYNIELCKIFRAFSLWIDETNLHQPNLCFSALGPKYCCERLKLIFNSDQQDWFDLVSIKLLKDDLKQKLHSWEPKKKCCISDQIPIKSNEKSSGERILQHLTRNENFKPLSCSTVINPPMREIENIALSSWNVLVQLIESKQSIIFDKARFFTELASKLKQLNFNYENLVPQEFFNEDVWETDTKSCHKALKCSGPATFNLKIQRYVTNQRICEKLDNNRVEHRLVQNQLLNLPVTELCTASIHIENYIRALSKEMENAQGEECLQFKSLGVSLFYHQIEAVNKVITSVKSFTPSRNFFSTSIESLGNVFICNQEEQLCALAEAILKYPEAGELAFDVFNPNVASISVFINLYEIITSAVRVSPPNTVFVLLYKIDLRGILKGKNANFCDRRKLFKQICKTLLECGSNPSAELQMVHDVITNHFRITLLWAFPEFYEDVIAFVLNGMETNGLAINVWYGIIHCFGCSTLNEKSTMSTIECALKKYADDVLLPPDQQIFVSSQPINIKEVAGTLERLHKKFMNERSSHNIYEFYEMHVKPFGIFLAVLTHSMLSVLNENIYQKQGTNISQLWELLHGSFYPWLHPLRKETSFVFPWTVCDEQIKNAKFLFQLFIICLRNFHEKLSGYNCEKCILSYFWNSYVEIYVKPGFRHYAVSVCHSECLSLPWDQFHPDSEDLEGMCCVLQSDLLESRDFLAKLSLKIPWIEIMKNISDTKSPEYVRNTLVTLGKLLIISGLDVSLTKSNVQQNNLKALEDLSWHFISLDDAETLLQLYYSTSDPMSLLNEEQQNSSDVYVLQFLKIVCCMVMAPDAVDHPHANDKRLYYLHKYVTALTECINGKNELILKNPEKFHKIIPSMFTDIEKIIATVVKPEQQMSFALPLVNEVVGFLNKISNSKLEDIVIDSILIWLKANPRSPLLLPCVQTACRSLNQMTSAVMIIECCIATRFNTDLHQPSDADTIWQLILSSFKIRSSMIGEFIHACVNKNACLTLYCYLLEMIPRTTNSENMKLLLLDVVDWIDRCEVKEVDEAKYLLLWDKILELSIMLANHDNLQVVKTVLSKFCGKIIILGEDQSHDGFLGFVGFGRSSSLSVNFRFLCRIVVAFLLLQMPLNASLRLQPMDPGLLPIMETKNTCVSSKANEPSPSSDALKAVENVRNLLRNKPYSALRDLVNSAIEFITDPRHCLNESRILLKDYALHVFPKHYYLYALG